MLVTQMLVLHKVAKRASVGNEITCPTCGKRHIKEKRSYVFCKIKCSDVYHNSLRIRNR